MDTRPSPRRPQGEDDEDAASQTHAAAAPADRDFAPLLQKTRNFMQMLDDASGADEEL